MMDGITRLETLEAQVADIERRLTDLEVRTAIQYEAIMNRLDRIIELITAGRTEVNR